LSGENGSPLFYYLYKKNMIKNVLPFFLDGGIETISSTGGGTKTWSGKSSFVEVSGTTACTLSIGDQDENGRPIKHGTMLVVTKTGASGQIDVDPSSDFTGDNVFSLNTVRDAVLLMYKGPSTSNALGEWIPLTRFEVDTDTLFAGGSVTGATTFSSDVTLGDGRADKVEINGKLVQGNISQTDLDAQSGTISAANFLTGVVVHTSVSEAGVITFDTAANLISGLELQADNQVAKCLYINDGNQNVTLNGGSPTGVTYVNNPTVAAEGAATLVVRRTGATAVSVYIV
jgi:hypothetical protein